MTGLYLVSIAAVLWGTVGVASSLMTDLSTIDPAVAGMMRTALGALSLLITAEMLGIPRVDRRRLPLRLLAVFGVAGAVFQTCLFAAFDAVGVTVTVAVTVCAPVVLLAAGEAIWNRRRPETCAAAAIGIASIGVFLALGGGTHSSGGEPVTTLSGVALLVVASLAFALVAAVARGLGGTMHPLRGAGLGLIATTCALAIAVLLRPEASLFSLVSLPGEDLAILGYTGIVATGGAYLAFILGLHLSRSSAAGIVPTLIEPGVAAVLAALILQERLAPQQVIGCTLMLVAMIGFYLVERRVAARRDADLPPGPAPVFLVATASSDHNTKHATAEETLTHHVPPIAPLRWLGQPTSRLPNHLPRLGRVRRPQPATQAPYRR